MENTFVIAWRSKTEPRWGQGKKLFSREEAQELAIQLNEEYPAFIHQPLNVAEESAVRSAIEDCKSSIINIDFAAPKPSEAPVSSPEVIQVAGLANEPSAEFSDREVALA